MKISPFVVYMLILSEAGKESNVVENAKKFPGVVDVHPVYGEYDIVTRIELNDFTILEQTVTQIRRIPGVLKTATLISSS